jgi:hypothetical protein
MYVEVQEPINSKKKFGLQKQLDLPRWQNAGRDDEL